MKRLFPLSWASGLKKWKTTIVDRWTAFRTWQIGDCTEAAGQGDKMLGKEFFRGTIDSALPFLSGETIRTLQQLLFRPGYMIREFLRGKHNHTLSPLTAMIVFFAVQVLLTNMVAVNSNGTPTDVYETVVQKMHESTYSPEEDEWGDRFALQIVGVVARIYYVTHLDQYLPEEHTPSEQVLAGVEGWLRSQGVFTFITQLLLLSLSLWLVGRRHYRLTFSAAASIAAYMLCQLCFFNTLLILFTLGSRQMIPLWLIALLLFENIYQLLGIGYKPAIGYVVKLLLMLLFLMALGLLLFAGLVSLYAYGKM